MKLVNYYIKYKNGNILIDKTGPVVDKISGFMAFFILPGGAQNHNYRFLLSGMQFASIAGKKRKPDSSARICVQLIIDM